MALKPVQARTLPQPYLGSRGRFPLHLFPAPRTPAAPRAQIHAVIVSSLSDPSQILTENVNLTGGIVALGSPDSTNPPRFPRSRGLTRSVRLQAGQFKR
jgi:hypothetical protein